MHRLLMAFLLWTTIGIAFACSEPPSSGPLPATLSDWSTGAQLFDGLGKSHRAISTKNADTQAYFDQGLRLLWAFNHDEAARSFARAAMLDKECAICYWGFALAVGPNYNQPILTEPRARLAWDALRQAQQHATHASTAEQALIGALAERYRGPSPLDPASLAPISRAYATAMARVAESFPEDLDVQALYAEALMNANPWKLWTLEGQPGPDTARIVEILERVLRADPQHPGANHYYVHAIEASPHPERALLAAQRLQGMMPDAGHLEHMPAHILQRVGRYVEAAAANRRGAEADQRYFARTKALDYYGVYTSHNFQFLMYSAAMAGREAETLDAAQHLRRLMPDSLLQTYAGYGFDWYAGTIYAALARFGHWDELLSEPAPASEFLGKRAGYLSARISALIARKQFDEAQKTMAALEDLAAHTAPDYAAGLNVLSDLLKVAIPYARAQIAAAQQRTPEALKLYGKAAANEDRLAYDEPRAWFIPVRQAWGNLLLASGDAAAAAQVYEEDLARNPDNGWSLFGLQASLAAQHKDTADAEQRLRAAWKDADVTLHASIF